MQPNDLYEQSFALKAYQPTRLCSSAATKEVGKRHGKKLVKKRFS